MPSFSCVVPPALKLVVLVKLAVNPLGALVKSACVYCMLIKAIASAEVAFTFSFKYCVPQVLVADVF